MDGGYVLVFCSFSVHKFGAPGFLVSRSRFLNLVSRSNFFILVPRSEFLNVLYVLEIWLPPEIRV